jgi:hypothetical protein
LSWLLGSLKRYNPASCYCATQGAKASTATHINQSKYSLLSLFISFHTWDLFGFSVKSLSYKTCKLEEKLTKLLWKHMNELQAKNNKKKYFCSYLLKNKESVAKTRINWLSVNSKMSVHLTTHVKLKLMEKLRRMLERKSFKNECSQKLRYWEKTHTMREM